VGPFHSRILITTDHPKYPQIEIPVFGEVANKLVIAPTEIILAGKDGDVVTRYIVARSMNGAQFKILGIESSGPTLQANITSMDPNSYRIDINNLTVSKEWDGQSIRVRTDFPGMQDVTIPVRVIFSP
jgi:hypothetical protein